ncbi:hypothetical protein Hanom_Chr12g01141781 [Helianthus anomalus]
MGCYRDLSDQQSCHRRRCRERRCHTPFAVSLSSRSLSLSSVHSPAFLCSLPSPHNHRTVVMVVVSVAPCCHQRWWWLGLFR